MLRTYLHGHWERESDNLANEEEREEESEDGRKRDEHCCLKEGIGG